MNRRDFIATSGVLGIGSPGLFNALPQQDPADQQYLELIEYKLHVGARRNRVSDFYRDVAIPALNRAGIGPVGVFSVLFGPTTPSLFVLLQHPSIGSVATLQDRLMDDDAYRTDGRDFLESTLDDPAYARVESSLMAAFKNLPGVVVPSALMDVGSRIYELRIYESHSQIAHQKKVHMFNEGGEIAIFQKTGLTPVFFGATRIGQRIPNLTYMLAFENMEERDRRWDVFRNDPDWLKLREDPYYLDTVSNITDFILRPAAFSQV